jgi:cold shock CspA family protein
MSEEVKEVEAPKKEETVISEVGETVYTGTVAWFNYKVGYGYIKPDDSSVNNGKDIFVHFRGISDNLAFVKEGKTPFKKLFREQRVKFNTAKNNRGIIAVNVDKLEEESSTETAASEEASAEG